MTSPQAFERFQRALPPDTAALIEKPAIATEWLPIKHWMKVMDTAHRVAFNGDLHKIVEMARVSMQDDLNRLYRFAIRLASTQFIIDRSARLWATYTRENGEMSVRVTSPTSADVVFHNVPAAEIESFFAFQEGSILGLLQLSGVMNIGIVSQRQSMRGGVLSCTWR